MSKPQLLNDSDLTSRAITAYLRSGDQMPQPSAASGLQDIDGKPHVVLINSNGTLAVYRVRTNGKLQRLEEIPAALQ
jgi:hypothetical protein